MKLKLAVSVGTLLFIVGISFLRGQDTTLPDDKLSRLERRHAEARSLLGDAHPSVSRIAKDIELYKELLAKRGESTKGSQGLQIPGELLEVDDLKIQKALLTLLVKIQLLEERVSQLENPEDKIYLLDR